MIEPGPQGWPFLIGRGRTVGYRVLAAPRFLVERGRAGTLARSVAGTTTEPRTVDLAPVDGVAAQAAFVSRRLVARDVGPTERADPTDQHGRPIEILHGFVVPAASIGRVAGQDLQRADEAVSPFLAAFLADEHAWEVRATDPFPLRSPIDPGAPAPTPTPTPPSGAAPPVPPAGDAVAGDERRGLRGLVAPLAAAAALVVIGAIGLSRLGPDRPSIEANPDTCLLEPAGATACTITVTTGVDRSGPLSIGPRPADAPLVWSADGCADGATGPCTIRLHVEGSVDPTATDLALVVATAAGDEAAVAVEVVGADEG